MLQDAISKMDPTVSNHTPKPTGTGSVSPPTSSPADHVAAGSAPPGLLKRAREVLSPSGWHPRQPGLMPHAFSRLLSSCYVPSI